MYRLVTRPHLERGLTEGGPGTRHFVSTQFLAMGYEPEHLSDGVPSVSVNVNVLLYKILYIL